MPGLVEGHSHLMAGGLWQFPFVGFHARTAPDGKVWPGCRDFDAVVARLIELEAQIATTPAASRSSPGASIRSSSAASA